MKLKPIYFIVLLLTSISMLQSCKVNEEEEVGEIRFIKLSNSEPLILRVWIENTDCKTIRDSGTSNDGWSTITWKGVSVGTYRFCYTNSYNYTKYNSYMKLTDGGFIEMTIK